MQEITKEDENRILFILERFMPNELKEFNASLVAIRGPVPNESDPNFSKYYAVFDAFNEKVKEVNTFLTNSLSSMTKYSENLNTVGDVYSKMAKSNLEKFLDIEFSKE